jgi:hypothetical protein
MRLATLNTTQGPRPAVLVGDRYVDLVASDPRFPTSVRQLLADPALLAAAREVSARPNAVTVPAQAASRPAGSSAWVPPRIRKVAPGSLPCSCRWERPLSLL